MSSLRSGSVHVAVVGADDTAASFRSGVGSGEPPVRVESRRPAAVHEGAELDGVDCLLVDDGASGVDAAAVVADAGEVDDAPPAVVLVAGGYDRTTAALAAGAADTLPRRIVEDDPHLLTSRVTAVVDCGHDRTAAEEHEKYSTLVEQSSDGVAVVQDESFTFVNDRFVEITGYDRPTLLDGPFYDVFTPESREVVRERYRRRVAGESPPDRYDVTVETADGDVRTLDLVVSRIRHGGEPATMVNFRDVTERRRREREYEQIFDGVNDTISVHDPESGEMIDANGSLCDLLGYEKSALLDRGATAISVEREGFTEERGKEIIDSVVESGESEQVEWQVETATGERRWLEINATTARIGGETRYLAIGRDVTERKRREREYEQIFNGVTDIINVYDPETGELVAVNDTMCELTGYDRETILDRGIGALSAAEEGYTPDHVRETLDEVMASDEPRDLDWALETADGEIRWLDVTATTATINGEDRLLTISRDVTERRRSEQRLRAILDRIDEAVFLGPVHELDRASPNPDFLSSGYEEIWGQPLSTLHERYPDGFFGTLHEDDEAGYRHFIEEIQAEVPSETAADRYAHEYRIERPDGEIRWVHSDFYPTTWTNGPPRIVIVSRDVTERKRRERRMASFNAATEDLTTADRPTEAARMAVEAATETLGLSSVCAFLYDDDEGVLRTEVCAGRVPDGFRDRVVDADGGPLWHAFATGSVVTPADGDDPAGLADWRALALGNHGLLLVGEPDRSLDPDTIQAAHVLAATLEAALNHLRGQRRLAAQEERLRTQTERAERLDRIATLTQQVEAAITDASGVTEVECAVCDRLADAGPYECAWIGGVEVGADRLTPRVTAGTETETGTGTGTGTGLSTTTAGPDPHPAVAAWRADEMQVAESLVADGPSGDWRRDALAAGVQSICAVPLTYDGITHGVLAVGASAPNAFAEREREVLDQLGTSVGYALAAIERRRALESDETVELVFRDADRAAVTLPFVRAARAADCRVFHERTVTRDGSVSVFFTFEADRDDVVTVADRTLPGEVSVVTDDADSTLVEVRTDSWFGSPLAEYGAVLRRATATPDGTTIVVEVSAQADVRSFVDRLRELAPSVELVAKRQHQRQERTPTELRDRVTERLTDRQREALTTALSAGYFEWPRENDGREVAERLGITQPTLNKHLRLAERKTFSLLFDTATLDAGGE
ncbi:PAS domain S-box protein [Haloplanus pelagicus]|jgi:PAS domain S-box-containing protein|uniref:PAS domain S-box protein n=1 Tax=Haloplanus pelagicus TaxID=2949995 RepID=UPI00203AAF14|nr:PAS domain S-box protein [Haloplanus sp. HW8-1]